MPLLQEHPLGGVCLCHVRDADVAAAANINTIAVIAPLRRTTRKFGGTIVPLAMLNRLNIAIVLSNSCKRTPLPLMGIALQSSRRFRLFSYTFSMRLGESSSGKSPCHCGNYGPRFASNGPFVAPDLPRGFHGGATGTRAFENTGKGQVQ